MSFSLKMKNHLTPIIEQQNHSYLWAATSGVTRGLSQGGQSLAEGGPLAKTQEKVKKW